MNRRGERDLAMERTRFRQAVKALYRELNRRADWETGQMPGGEVRYAPKLSAVFGKAGIGSTTGYEALAHLKLHGWYEPDQTAPAGKTAGLVKVGKDCYCSAALICQYAPCGKSLAGRRADARYCSSKHRVAALRARAVRLAVTDQPAEAAETVRVSVTDRPASRNGVTHIGVTDSPASRNKPQVSGPSNREIASKEQAVKEQDLKERERNVPAETANVLLLRPPRRPEVGPCTGCGRLCERYGPHGRPLCPPCLAAAQRRAHGDPLVPQGRASA